MPCEININYKHDTTPFKCAVSVKSMHGAHCLWSRHDYNWRHYWSLIKRLKIVNLACDRQTRSRFPDRDLEYHIKITVSAGSRVTAWAEK